MYDSLFWFSKAAADLQRCLCGAKSALTPTIRFKKKTSTKLNLYQYTSIMMAHCSIEAATNFGGQYRPAFGLENGNNFLRNLQHKLDCIFVDVQFWCYILNNTCQHGVANVPIVFTISCDMPTSTFEESKKWSQQLAILEARTKGNGNIGKLYEIMNECVPKAYMNQEDYLRKANSGTPHRQLCQQSLML